MLEAAGREFRSHGYDGVGVDGLAKAAGVTSGAFYSHFGSKDGAFDVVLAEGLDEVLETVPVYQREHGAEWVKEFVGFYLGRRHRKDVAGGCAMAALTSEVVRSRPEVHEAYEQKMSQITELIANGLMAGSATDRRARAWAMLGALIGGVNVARAMKSQRAADAVAQAAMDAAIKLAGRVRKSFG